MIAYIYYSHPHSMIETRDAVVDTNTGRQIGIGIVEFNVPLDTL